MTKFINYAHRGASAYAPGNTMTAFHKALEYDIQGIELDLQETKDHKLVIYHDDTLEKIHKPGSIKDYTYDELLTFDFGSWFSEEYKDERIVLFEDFAKEFLSMNLMFAIELKVANIAKQTLEIIRQYSLLDNIYISSFNYDILKEVREISQEVKLCWLVEDITKDTIEKLLAIKGNQIAPKAQNTTPYKICTANHYKLGVRLWGVFNEEILQKVYSYDCEGMTVNFPDKLTKLRNKRKVYFVRHGRTPNNDLDNFNGRYDEDINETGIHQAEVTRDLLKDKDIDLIICSPMLRARHTCNIINTRNIPVIYDERLQERDLGSWTLKPCKDIDYYEYWNYNFTKYAGDIESPKDIIARIQECLDEVLSKYPDQNILLVAHNGVARAVYTYFFGLPEEEYLGYYGTLNNAEVREYIG